MPSLTSRKDFNVVIGDHTIAVFWKPLAFFGQRSGASVCSLMSTRTLGVTEDAAKEVYGLRANVQAIFFRRRHQPRRPPPAKIRPGRPAPAMGPGTATSVAILNGSVT
jgi:hypothetical protein